MIPIEGKQSSWNFLNNQSHIQIFTEFEYLTEYGLQGSGLDLATLETFHKASEASETFWKFSQTPWITVRGSPKT
jgi:hypothetical protein